MPAAVYTEPRTLNPECDTQHPTPYTPHSTPHTLQPTTYTLHPIPYTIDSTTTTRLLQSKDQDTVQCLCVLMATIGTAPTPKPQSSKPNP